MAYHFDMSFLTNLFSRRQDRSYEAAPKSLERERQEGINDTRTLYGEYLIYPKGRDFAHIAVQHMRQAANGNPPTITDIVKERQCELLARDIARFGAGLSERAFLNSKYLLPNMLETVLRVVESDINDPTRALESYAKLAAPRSQGDQVRFIDRALSDRELFRTFVTNPEAGIFDKESFQNSYLARLQENVS